MITAKLNEARGGCGQKLQEGLEIGAQAVAGLAGLRAPCGLEPTSASPAAAQERSEAALCLRQHHKLLLSLELCKGLNSQPDLPRPLYWRGGGCCLNLKGLG